MDCIAIIPAKGTSQRLPRKNFQLCGGVPLWRRAVDCAAEAGIFSKIILSSETIVGFSRIAPAWFHARLNILSEEGVGVAAVVAAILAERYFQDDAFCVLWPTSPLRTPEFLVGIHAVFSQMRHPSLHTVDRFGQHEGTAIFMQTEEFLRRLSLDYKPGMPFFGIPDDYICDVNTPEDLADAERRLLARELLDAPK